MRKVLKYLSVMLLFGCAQQVAPTGGPKDETPPLVLSETPANLTTDFNSKQIVISFDEYIQLKSTSEQVVISPPMLISPTYQLKQKSLVVKFEQDLTPNTTYTINFGEAIADNNEGNVLKNYTYVFSTGAQLDSMQVKGKLVDAITGEPEKDALVMLYRNNIDSLPLDTIPDYFTRSSEDGTFHIKNVADQQYKIFALKDENANYRFDVPTEKIGFLDSLITPFTLPTPIIPDTTTKDTTAVLDSIPADTLKSIAKKGGSTIPNYEMVMFIEDDTTQFLKKAFCEYHGKLVFIYNRPIENFDIQVDGISFKKQWMLEDYSQNRDTVTVWTTDVVPDTMNLLLNVGNGQDTVEVVMKPRSDEIESTSSGKGKGAKKKTTEKFELTAKTEPASNRSPKPGEALALVWNHPVVGTDLSKVKLYEDSVRVKFDIEARDAALRRFGILYSWEKDRKYRLLVLDSAFTDLYGLWNDTIETNFTGSDKDMFGELSLNISEKPNTQLLIQVLSSSNTIIEGRAVSDKGIVTFSKLSPGKYTVQVVTDLNGNGKWDSGRYIEKLQPEPIKIIQQGSEVRANWNFELEWNPNGKE